MPRMHRERATVWAAYALLLALAPLVFPQGFALTLLSQIGITIIFALSYNMLFGQTGLLSFGHAVFSGLGAYIAVHTLNAIGQGSVVFPVTLLPLVGGLAGMAFGALFGVLAARRAGTTFAMISLGIGELVAAAALMFPGFLGGEGGITTNRTAGGAFLGIPALTLGPAIQVYALIAVWCFLSTAAMYAFTRTPLGRIANAVRDNPERAQFIGCDPYRVRLLVMTLAGFFAGVAGALSCINYEIVSPENVGMARSGGVLIATFIGGAGFFFGPILGAIFYSTMVIAIGALTKAWLLYLGVVFVLMVLYMPGGLARLIMANARAFRSDDAVRLLPAYAATIIAALVLAAGFIVLVEMTYHASLEGRTGPLLRIAGITLDTASALPWLVAAAGAIAGGVSLAFAGRRLAARWPS